MAKRDTIVSHGKHARQPSQASAASASRTRNVWRGVFVAALLIFIGSLLALGLIFFSYWKERDTYSDIADKVLDVSASTLADLKVDWNALKARNAETIAWVYVPGTQINYPVVQTTDNEKYLKTNFQGETNWVVSVGAIFLETTNSSSLTDANTIIYGHNMNDGSMFSAIADFADNETFNAHRDVYVLTPAGNFRIKTFALIHTSGNDPLVQTTFPSQEDFASYVEDKLARSVVKPTGEVPAAAGMGRIFTFSTCDNDQENARYVLFGYVAESTVPGIDGVEQGNGVARSAASTVQSGASSFAEGNDVGD